MIMSKEEAKSDMKMYVMQGWELKEETRKYYLLKKNTQKFGIHLLILIVMMYVSGTMIMSTGTNGLGILSIGGNIAYYFFSKKKKKIMK